MTDRTRRTLLKDLSSQPLADAGERVRRREWNGQFELEFFGYRFKPAPPGAA